MFLLQLFRPDGHGAWGECVVYDCLEMENTCGMEIPLTWTQQAGCAWACRCLGGFLLLVALAVIMASPTLQWTLDGILVTM